jgi:DNA-directed RNA polymerase specialized sigma24 family protein
MSGDGSVTHWVREIEEGNQAVAQELWERYFAKLVQLARMELRGAKRQMSDEEDVAISVFDSFCRAAENGRFPDLADRDSLWRLLVRMTARKAIDLRRHETRLRRGGPSSPKLHDEPTGDDALALVIGDTPSPEFSVMMAEEFQTLLSLIDDVELRTIALGKMEGYTNEELSERADCSIRTIERRLNLIREKLKQRFLVDGIT